MKWIKFSKYGLPPKPEHDIEVLLKVCNLPMRYIAATWDGNVFWVLEPLRATKAPWVILPTSEIGLEEWAYIEEEE